MIFMTTTSGSRAASEAELHDARAALADEQRRVRALALFSRRMSHDMSNFVTVVRTYSELLLADLPSDGAVHADVQEIHRAADAMIDYMNRIVRFAHTAGARSGTLQLDDAVAEIVQNSTHSRRTQMECSSGARVRIDAVWLSDAVGALLANACEASPGGSTVRVKTWRENIAHAIVDGSMPIESGSWAVLEFEDDGAGFAEEVRLDALDPFVTTKHAVRGAGFGLALARSAAWHGGGQLVVDSASASRAGTRVRMWLPVHDEVPPA